MSDSPNAPTPDTADFETADAFAQTVANEKYSDGDIIGEWAAKGIPALARAYADLRVRFLPLGGEQTTGGWDREYLLALAQRVSAFAHNGGEPDAPCECEKCETVEAAWSAIRYLAKSLATHGAGERDWPEDAAHENGNYQCRCIRCSNPFMGHKRRVLCRVCAAPARPEAGEPMAWLPLDQKALLDDESIEAARRVYEQVAADTEFVQPLRPWFDLMPHERAVLGWCIRAGRALATPEPSRDVRGEPVAENHPTFTLARRVLYESDPTMNYERTALQLADYVLLLTHRAAVIAAPPAAAPVTVSEAMVSAAWDEQLKCIDEQQEMRFDPQEGNGETWMRERLRRILTAALAPVRAEGEG